MGTSQYETVGVINRLGAFCLAKNGTVADHMWDSPQISVKDAILDSIDLILLSLLFGFCLGLIYMVLTSLCPKVMIRLVFVGIFLTMLLAGIYTIVKPVSFFSPHVWNVLLGIAFIITGIVFLIYMVCYNK